MKKVFLVLLVVLLSIGFAFANGEQESKGPQEKIVYKISSGLPESHFETVGLRKMEKYIEEKSNGVIDIQLFPNNQLADDKEALEMIQQGVVQMCPSGTSALSNFGKSFGILSSPYLFKNIDDVKRILNGEWGNKLLATLNGTGFLGLGYGVLGFTNMSNNVRPIVKASDMQGLKIRCVANPLLLDSFKAIGASPVAMSFNDLFSAMQQGVVDGQFNPMTTIYSSNFQEVQKYISKTCDITSLIVFIVDEKVFNSLKPEYQTIIEDGIKIATDYMLESVVKEEADAEQKLLATGKVKINEVDDSVKTELFKKAYPVIEKYGNSVNPELFADLKKELGVN